MGQAVVFTVSLDSDNVEIGQTQPRPPRHTLRRAFAQAWRDRHWRLALLLVAVLPAVAAGVTAAITGGPWATTVFLVAAAVATMASGAWAAATPLSGARDARLAGWLVTGLCGCALAVASVPGIWLIAAHEEWRGQAAAAVMAVLALIGAAGAWLGMVLAHVRRPRFAAVCAALAVTLAPLALAAALLPTTRATDEIVAHTFTTDYVAGRPAYVCGSETVEVTRGHTEEVAWLGLASPISWVVDAPSFTTHELAFAAQGTAAKAQGWTRSTRVGPDSFMGYCFQPTSLGPPTAVKEARYDGAGPVGATSASVAAAGLGLVALALALWRRQSS